MPSRGNEEPLFYEQENGSSYEEDDRERRCNFQAIDGDRLPFLDKTRGGSVTPYCVQEWNLVPFVEAVNPAISWKPVSGSCPRTSFFLSSGHRPLSSSQDKPPSISPSPSRSSIATIVTSAFGPYLRRILP
eukprot:GFKZ01012795.1.p1 GENE.GFKZ01012795.1~~GFKZ01012795.1.p1  ORF type:complete len:131 (+),score=9.08 GFKZ01012795.1:170-562(+)